MFLTKAKNLAIKNKYLGYELDAIDNHLEMINKAIINFDQLLV